jgi:ABC-type transport system involved in multi-copper enzyme maturation permease subunit
VSASEATAAVSARPSTLVALYRLLLRTQITVPRLLGIAALGALSVVIGLFARWDDNSPQAAADGVSSYGLAILVPLAALWLGTSAVGDLVEDRLLAYLWLKPVPRWQLPAAAVLATVCVVVPLTALPLTASALVAGAGDVAWAAFVAALLAALAYAGLFVAAGLWFRRAIWWGLAFVLIWENLAAYTAEGVGRFTVIGWASAVLGLVPDVEVQLEAGSAAVAFVVLPAIAIAGWLAATWRYRRADID